MKSLDNFASLEITNAEEVIGGTFGLLSLFGSCAPKPVCQPAPVCQPVPVCQPAPCYTPPAPSCNTGGYSNPCAPKPTCNTRISLSFSFSLGGCR